MLLRQQLRIINQKMITLTESAAAKIKTLLIKKEETGIRAAVSGGGCSGFTYNLEFDNQNDDDWCSC